MADAKDDGPKTTGEVTSVQQVQPEKTPEQKNLWNRIKEKLPFWKEKKTTEPDEVIKEVSQIETTGGAIPLSGNEVVNSGKNINYKEVEIPQGRIFEIEYHGQNIRILEIEHRPPPDGWRERLIDEISNADEVALEYCPPELYQMGAFSEPILGGLIQKIGNRMHRIQSFYNYAAAVAGEHDKKLLAIDPADSATYQVFESLGHAGWEIGKKAGFIPKDVDYFGKSNTEIDPSEDLSRSVAERRLITARGLMQQSLFHQKNNKNKKIILITSRYHAQRVVEHINNQINAEQAQTVAEVKEPQDMISIGDLTDKNNMNIYRFGPLDKTIRTFSRSLSAEQYASERKILEIITDHYVRWKYTPEWNRMIELADSKIKQQLKDYINSNSRIWELKENTHDMIAENIINMINTAKSWQQESVKKIY